jgi:hypothetical protein
LENEQTIKNEQKEKEVSSMDTYSNEKYTNTNEIGGDMHHTKIKSYAPNKNCN